ncbi:hypothetical protein [Candidatus Finniella inopinata]|uniref:Uncharacterized protein n=1 Tax=Candidatus Finniella inopinata TaxID=1696036 RepID=A0A4Q7DL56_9PROT|nr:hypothetical protein [Candidatus Finniella inopinata]RZI45436.1 hypothetical protein EQU50_07040 [Candidatus Finniella inopinata]
MIPWVAAAILKSLLKNAGTLKLRATVFPGSGFFKLDFISIDVGGSPLNVRRGGEGGFVAII